jgi:hypothetical protein
VLKNLAHLKGLKAIQFAVLFYDQGAIYLYKKSMITPTNKELNVL